MVPNRSVVAVMGVAVLITLGAEPAIAGQPERPPSAEEARTSRAKVAAALEYADEVRADGTDFVGLSCVTPTGGPSGGPVTNGCYVPSGVLPVEARDQVNGFYCGPAVGQVIANYAWAMPHGANKYVQAVIAGWMGTDANRRTDAPNLAAGLERATSGSPRRPANFAWTVTQLVDANRNGTTGDELHAFVRAAVSDWKMPVAISLKPHEPGARYHLSSWPNPVAAIGHWIAAYGWYSSWTGTSFARISYTDSSRDEGGGTGTFSNPTLELAWMIGRHTARFVW